MRTTQTNRQTRQPAGLAVLGIAGLGLMLSACPEDKPECTAGTENCSCDKGACNSGLVCEDDKCVKDNNTCPDGSLDCPCYPNGTCDAHAGVTMECVNNVCSLPTCPIGTLNCPCNSGSCQPNLDCVSDVCVAHTIEDGISVGAASVRACDLLFDVGSTGGDKVVFDGAVKGTFRREGTRIALAFTALTDAALTGPVAQVQNASGVAVDISSITPTQVRCYDRLGVLVATPQVTLK